MYASSPHKQLPHEQPLHVRVATWAASPRKQSPRQEALPLMRSPPKNRTMDLLGTRPLPNHYTTLMSTCHVEVFFSFHSFHCCISPFYWWIFGSSVNFRAHLGIVNDLFFKKLRTNESWDNEVSFHLQKTV